MKKSTYLTIIILLSLIILPSLWGYSRSANIKTSTTSTQGLVGHWPLDSASNRSTTVTADQTPNRNHGTAGGGITLGGATDMHGQAGRATEFDGNNDNIDLGDLTYLNSVSKFSMSFWMNQDVLDQTDYIFRKYYSGSGVFVESWNDGCFYAEIGTGWGRFDYSTVISAGTWYHIAVIYDGTQPTNATKLKIYVNGTQQTLTLTTVPATTPNSSTRSAYIGYTADAFDGKLADFRIYNRAISTTEITSLYNSYRPKIAVSSLEKGLVASYPLSQDTLKSTTTIADKTPNRNIGTLFGSPTFTTDQHGQAARAMSFNGSSQYVLNSTANFRSSDSAGTISAWIKCTGTLNTVFSSADESVTTNYFQIAIGAIAPAHNNMYITYRNGSDAYITRGSTTVNDGNWHHIVIISSGSAWSMYVDGQTESLTVINVTNDGGWFHDVSGRDNFTIGTLKRTSAGQYFNGSIADVRIYNRALTTTGITSLYNAYRPKIAVSSLEKGLVASYPLSQDTLKSTTTIADKTPNRNHGTLVGSPTFTTDQHGQAAKAMSFNGSSQYITMSNVLTLGSNPFTISLWAKKSSNQASYKAIICTTPWNTAANTGIWTNGNNLFVEAYGNGGSFYYTSDAMTNDIWYHFVWIRNSGSPYFQIYRNGSLEQSFTTAVGSIAVSSFELGRYNSGNYFNGSIADVRIYNRALSATEVTALYNSY